MTASYFSKDGWVGTWPHSKANDEWDKNDFIYLMCAYCGSIMKMNKRFLEKENYKPSPWHKPSIHHSNINLGKPVNTVRLNNQTMRIRGNNVQISNGRVIVDGIDISAGKGNKFAITTIIIEGDTKHVETDCGDITVVGNVEGDVKTDCGNIKIERDLRGTAYTDCGDVTVKGRKI